VSEMIGNVFGNYKITEKIGEGGMGSVFKGLDLMLEREVAIKVLRPELAGQAEIVERFRTEAVTLARLNHPRVATLYSFSRHGDLFLMVMEYVRGTTLGDHIERHGAIRPASALPLFCQALEGIEHAHALGVVHRDLKPGNIMVTDAGSAKVMDFGIARVLGASRLTRAGHLLGTVEYMSPEQVRGQHADTRSDIYSAGIVLYEMLTGRVPFASDSEFELMRAQVEEPPPPPSSLLADIPEEVERAILRALAKRPEGRFASAGEFRAALLDAYQTAPLSLGARPPASRAASPDAAPRDDDDTGRGISGGDAPHFDADARETSAPAALERGATPSGNYARGTRLAPDSRDLAHGARDDFGSVKGGAGERAPNARKLPSALLSKLDWRHYAGACATLALLLFASVVLVGDGGPPDATPKSEATSGRATEQPAATITNNAAPAPTPTAETAPTPAPPPAAPPPRPPTFTTAEGVRPVETVPRAAEEVDGGGRTAAETPRADAKQQARKGNAPRAKADDRARRRREALRALEQ
jgi:Protein kinase domain